MGKDIFSLLDSRLSEELIKQGFQTPTPIQVRSIPRILSGESVLLIAPTGHGKTEGAILPIIHNYELPINHQKNYHYFLDPRELDHLSPSFFLPSEGFLHFPWDTNSLFSSFLLL